MKKAIKNFLNSKFLSFSNNPVAEAKLVQRSDNYKKTGPRLITSPESLSNRAMIRLLSMLIEKALTKQGKPTGELVAGVPDEVEVPHHDSLQHHLLSKPCSEHALENWMKSVTAV